MGINSYKGYKVRRHPFGYWIGTKHYKGIYDRPLILKKISLRDSREVDISTLSKMRVNYWLIHNLILLEILEGKPMMDIYKDRNINRAVWHIFHWNVCEGYYYDDIEEAKSIRRMIRDEERTRASELL